MNGFYVQASHSCRVNLRSLIRLKAYLRNLSRFRAMEISDPFAHSVNSLGTAGFLNDLDGSKRSLEALNASGSESEVTDLLEQSKDLVDITASLNNLATKERRNPSAHSGALSASDLVHLQSVVGGTATIIEDCSMLIEALQSSLDNIAHERNAVGYAAPESQLRNQAWYEETSSSESSDGSSKSFVRRLICCTIKMIKTKTTIPQQRCALLHPHCTIKLPWSIQKCALQMYMA